MRSFVRQFNFPTLIRWGEGASSEIPDHLLTENLRCPLVVVDPKTASASFFNELIRDLNSRTLHPEVFNVFGSFLTEHIAKDGVSHFKNSGCDCIIAVGNATALSAGRAIAFFNQHQEPVEFYDEAHGGEKNVIHPLPHFITVPVAAGGNEAARTIELRNEITLEKSVIFSPSLMAKVIFADPITTRECNGKEIREWKMVSYSTLVESWFSLMHHPICEGIALEGLSLLHESEKNIDHPGDTRDLELLMLASLMSGIASQKGLGLHAAITDAISACSGCARGLAGALLFDPVMRFSLEQNQPAAMKFSQRLGWREKSHEAIINKIISWPAHLALPSRLSEIGLYAADLEVIVAMVVEDPIHAQGPRPVTRSEIRSILSNVL